jgi:hypothetical protein
MGTEHVVFVLPILKGWLVYVESLSQIHNYTPTPPARFHQLAHKQGYILIIEGGLTESREEGKRPIRMLVVLGSYQNVQNCPRCN